MTFPALSTVLDDVLFTHAHRFGAVEFIETRHSNAGTGGGVHTFVSVQFTTAEAAGLFYRWADGLGVEQIVQSYWQDRQAARPSRAKPAPEDNEENSTNGTAQHLKHTIDKTKNSSGKYNRRDAAVSEDEAREDAWWNAFQKRVSEGRLQLVSKLAPHDTRKATTTLLLGPNVMVSTPLVTSLFTGLFCAKHVEYDRATRGFLIDFPDAAECRLALHALQCSMWTVFNIPLSYR